MLLAQLSRWVSAMHRVFAAVICALTAVLASGTATGESVQRRIHIGTHVFLAEVAADDASRMRGLMFREHLPGNAAMLFIFEHEQPLAFWMKNTLIGLDILYFDRHGKLVDLQANLPPCRIAECPAYPSARPARYAVELAAGTSAELEIKTGDQLCWGAEVGPVLPGCREHLD